MDKQFRNFSVQLSFEEIHLPPFDDIMVLDKKCPHGNHGVSPFISGGEIIKVDFKLRIH